MTKKTNLPNREDKAPELLPDEREALIRALETGRVRSMTRLIELGLIYIGPHPTIEGESKLQLTPAGHILAVELRKSDREIDRLKSALNRTSPPSAEWVPVGELIERLPAGHYIGRSGKRVEKCIRGMLDWDTWDPDDLLCIAGHPIEVPPVPGETT